MLVVRPKISELAFRVFGRSLHPELFQIYASRTISRQQYELKVDITSSGHVVTWNRHGIRLSEVACSFHQPLPQHRLLLSEPILAPSQERIRFEDCLDYECRFQLDPADPITFDMIQRELMKSAPCEGLVFQFQASGRLSIGAISYINIQSRQNTVHLRAFHTFPDAYTVLKCESSFTVAEVEALPEPG